MASPLRIEYANACYHVPNRGTNRTQIFHEDEHYQLFIAKLGEFSELYKLKIFCFCFMPNHFHIYLQTPRTNLSLFMQSFLTSFCVSYNKKRRSSGHLFQGRFKSHLVESQLYHSKLSRYIHLNPVRTTQIKPFSTEEKRDYLKNLVICALKNA